MHPELKDSSIHDLNFMSHIKVHVKEKIQLTNLPVLFDELLLDKLNQKQQTLITQIDATLPQTQCGLCHHPEGCLPYAYSIVVNHEEHNKCIPGGQAVTDIIRDTLQKNQDTQDTNLTALPSKWTINTDNNRPQEMRAVIREDDCIGCTKCIPACPVDAIVGTGKHIHTIFTDLCTGCELCIPPCPVDCIDLVPVDRLLNEEQREEEQDYLRTRYHTHLDRVHEQIQDKHNSRPVVSMVESKLSNSANISLDINEADAKYAITTAKIRTKIKKLEKQLSTRENEKKRQELMLLQQELIELT